MSDGGLLWKTSGPWTYFASFPDRQLVYSSLGEVELTAGEALTFSHACPYSTVAEFLEKSSEVKA